MIYNKLVRDRIPELIEEKGERAVLRVLDEEEFRRCLEDKLDEEVAEFHRDRNLEELADILEVVYALADSLGASRQALAEACATKREARGGFDSRIFLISKN